MKKVLALVFAVALFAGFAAAQSEGGQTPAAATSTSTAELAFEKNTHNFGKIPKGTPVTYEFSFTNSGIEPLIVNNVQKTCGCTVTDWTKAPVLPGQTGTVSAQYNAARVGKFRKPIHVHSNAKNEKITLYFEGEVVETPSGEPTKPGVLTPQAK